MNIGHKHWTIAEGWIPPLGDETVSFLNISAHDAQVKLTVYYSDRDPVGPYRITVPAGRIKRLGFNDLRDPEPIPRATSFAATIGSDVPIVVQHSGLDAHPTAVERSTPLPSKSSATHFSPVGDEHPVYALG